MVRCEYELDPLEFNLSCKNYEDINLPNTPEESAQIIREIYEGNF